jgi:predicted nucleic acid-binding protein
VSKRLQLILGVVDHVYGIERQDVLRAGEIVQNPAGLSARDALHVAIMERYGTRSILSFDEDFDRWPGLNRIGHV